MNKILVVMDAIEQIKAYKDSSLALMLEAQARGCDIFYSIDANLYIEDGQPKVLCRQIEVHDDNNHWFDYLTESHEQKITDFDVTFMRKDPPFDMQYIFATQILDLASSHGHLVVNSPSALLHANEKMVITWFPELCPPTLVSARHSVIDAFINKHKKVVLKPLDSMAGTGIYSFKKGEDNLPVILESMTLKGIKQIMVQAYIPEVKKGDKRIMMIDGQVFPYGLKRVPQKGDFRANLAVGGIGEAFELSQSDKGLAEKIGPTLKQRGIVFAGIDVIGDKLTEINITSPTCIREIDRAFDVNIASQIFDAIVVRNK